MPDELEIIPEGRSHHKPTTSNPDLAQSPRSNIPKTVVDKVEPSSPSHGEVPRTSAHAKRMADAVPDLVRPVGSPRNAEDKAPSGAPSDISIPTTIVTKVDSKPSYGEVPGTDAYDKRRGDAEPDVVEKRGDSKGRYL